MSETNKKNLIETIISDLKDNWVLISVSIILFWVLKFLIILLINSENLSTFYLIFWCSLIITVVFLSLVILITSCLWKTKKNYIEKELPIKCAECRHCKNDGLSFHKLINYNDLLAFEEQIGFNKKNAKKCEVLAYTVDCLNDRAPSDEAENSSRKIVEKIKRRNIEAGVRYLTFFYKGDIPSDNTTHYKGEWYKLPSDAFDFDMHSNIGFDVMIYSIYNEDGENKKYGFYCLNFPAEDDDCSTEVFSTWEKCNLHSKCAKNVEHSVYRQMNDDDVNKFYRELKTYSQVKNSRVVNISPQDNHNLTAISQANIGNSFKISILNPVAQSRIIIVVLITLLSTLPDIIQDGSEDWEVSILLLLGYFGIFGALLFILHKNLFLDIFKQEKPNRHFIEPNVCLYQHFCCVNSFLNNNKNEIRYPLPDPTCEHYGIVSEEWLNNYEKNYTEGQIWVVSYGLMNEAQGDESEKIVRANLRKGIEYYQFYTLVEGFSEVGINIDIIKNKMLEGLNDKEKARMHFIPLERRKENFTFVSSLTSIVIFVDNNTQSDENIRGFIYTEYDRQDDMVNPELINPAVFYKMPQCIASKYYKRLEGLLMHLNASNQKAQIKNSLILGV